MILLMIFTAIIGVLIFYGFRYYSSIIQMPPEKTLRRPPSLKTIEEQSNTSNPSLPLPMPIAINREIESLPTTLASLHQQYGSVISIDIGSKHPVVSIDDTNILKKLTIDSRPTEHLTNHYGAACLRNFEHHKHIQAERKLITHGPYGHQSLNTRINEFAAIASELFQRNWWFEENHIIEREIHTVTHEYAFRVSIRVALGLICDASNTDAITSLRDAFDTTIATNILRPDGRFVSESEAVHDSVALIESMITQCIRGEVPLDGDSFLSVLKKSVDPASSKPYSDEQMLQFLVVMIVGAYTPIASTLSWALILLSRHPDEQKRLQRELGGDSKPFADALKSVSLMMILKETLRLYPPYSYVARRTTTTVVATPYTLLPETTVLYPIARFHTNEDDFPEPSRFNPEHFVEERSSKRRPIAFCPFGLGVRACPGERMAWVELKAFMVVALRSYSFSYVGKESKNEELCVVETDVLAPGREVQLAITKVNQ